MWWMKELGARLLARRQQKQQDAGVYTGADSVRVSHNFVMLVVCLVELRAVPNPASM